MKFIIFSFIAIFLVSSASNKSGYRTEGAVEKQLLTMNKEEVLIDLGPPTKKRY